jgi:ribonuclease P protein component
VLTLISAQPNAVLRRTLAIVELGVQQHAMPAKKSARFPRKARLLRHADFERVYKQGRRHFSATMTVFYLPRPEQSWQRNAEKKFEQISDRRSEQPSAAQRHDACFQGLRVGFTVGRALGGAVQRNRMKRRLREAVRMTRPEAGAAADVVINPKKSLLAADFADVLKEMTRAFAVIEQKLAQPGNSPGS